MQKAKQYDWKDSNMALVGSDEDREVKKKSAQEEPAWRGIEHQSAGQLRVWRIVKFKVQEWPKEDYGKFFDGDSYIVINIYKEADSEDLKYDIHFWIGKHSTADEYGTAAYKTVELDNYLDDKPIQHREVQHHESPLFKSYFKTIEYWKGGAESGFRHVKTKEYQPRLLHFHGERRQITVKELNALRSKLDSSDVFILDSGSCIYQWNGKTCNKDEKFKAVQYVQELKNQRGTAKSETLDEEDIESNHEFYKILDRNADKADDGDDDDVVQDEATADKSLHRDQGKSLHCLSDASGELVFSCVQTGTLDKSALTDDDVYIVDDGREVFVYIGDGCSGKEKSNAFTYAHKYLQGTKHPLIPVTCIKNKNNKRFSECFNA